MRKNSSIAAVEKVQAAIELKAELEGVELHINEKEFYQMAAGILHFVKYGWTDLLDENTIRCYTMTRKTILVILVI